MTKTSQLLIIVAALILLIGAGGCGLKLVADSDGDVAPTETSADTSETTNQQVGGRNLAAKWIEDNAPTYKFDGEGLVFMQSVALRCGDDEMLYEFVFNSRNNGYGNRINEALDGQLISHTIRVTIKNNQVIAAVTDNRYNEITGQFGELATDPTSEERCL